MRDFKSFACAVGMSVALVGCALPSGGDDTGDDGVGDDGGGDDGGGDDGVEPPPPVHPAAVYTLTSDLDVSATTVLPTTLYDAIELMRMFETSPGEAILELAELAGVPAIDTLRAALPDVLESRLIGWIDDRLAGSELVITVGEIVDLADTAFGQVELGSTLDVAAGVHALSTVAVEVDGHRAELDVESPVGDVIGLTADVDVTAAGTELAIGAHTFGVKVGTAAWAALTAAIQARYGADLQTVLATAIDCAGLATAISNKCLLGQCVGHRAELEAACTGAVDYAVDQLHDQITGVDFDAVILDAGHATGVDADRDGTLETLAGTWTAALDLGMGPRPVPATFTGLAQ